jgi:hypothetical protein
MSVAGVLTRYTAAYIALMLLLAVGFALAGVRTNEGVNIAALAGAIYWPCLAFGQKNGRYFDAGEKKRVLLGMIGIDLAIQLASGLVFLAAVALDLKALLIGLAVVGALHALTICLFVFTAGKLVARQHRALRT